MYGGDPHLDLLTPYVDYTVAPKNNNVFLDVDSVSPVNTEHDFKTIFLYSIEDYRKQIWTKLDTMSTGVKNPLRFFDFSMPCAELTDPRWFPKPTQELLPTGGEVKLEFDPGKAKVDMSKAENASEINGLRNKLEALDLDPNSILKTFTITGTASPDGSYESNQKLASARMKEVTNIILSVLRPDTRNFIKVTTNARVAEWNEVADLMEADGLTAEADQIKSITSKYSKDRASQALSIRRLPFYTNLLSKKYLPMLRKVEYQYEYSQFRTRTDQEILEIYKRDPQMINTRYECSRLFETTQDPELLRSYYNLSLQKFPINNYLASNRLACLNLKENKPDLNVLAKYIKEDAPQEVLQNQVVTALKAKEYQYADSVASFIYRTEDSEDLIAIVEVLNGNFDNASRILLKGGLNEVLVL